MSAALRAPSSAPSTNRIHLGYQARAWQKRAHNLIARYRWNILAIHRRAGKTVLAVMILIDAALRCQLVDGRMGYVAPYLKQAKQVAWSYLKTYASRVPGVQISESELFVQFSNGARVTIDGADNADAMRGRYWDGLVLDEFAHMKPGVYGEVIRPALADRKGWCLFVSTPKGMNAFYDLWEKAQASPKWGALKLDVFDTQVFDTAEIEDAREFVNDAQYRQEWLCDFSASAENILITIDVVNDAMRRKVPAITQLGGLPKVLGVDVARFGGDRSVIAKRWGHFMFKPQKHRGVDNMQLVGLVGQEINAFRPDVVFIDGGRGEGVIDRLRQLGHSNVIEVNFGAKATDPHYANRRTEMYDRLKLWVEDGGVLPNDHDLKRELCVTPYKYDAQDRMVLLSKDGDEVKKLLGGISPDVADACALTVAETVIARDYDRHGENTEVGRAHTEYDVFESLNREVA